MGCAGCRFTYGALSRQPVPREVMDRWFGPAIAQRAVRRDVAKYVRGSAQGRRDLLAAADTLRNFEGPALIAWASENRMMPREHGRRLAELLPQGRLVEIPNSYTLIMEDQPARLIACMREFLRDTQPQAGPSRYT
jgi:pimeloyl-ACP methyl ester carboxylesterase